MALEDELKKLAEAKLANPSLFIVDVVVSARKGPKKVLVIVDGDQGVSIDDCADISRELSKTLDELPYLEDSYLLEVSTPGVDFPLKLQRQYTKNIGRRLKIKTADSTVEGKLEAVTSDVITISVEEGTGKKKTTKSIDINFSQIEKAFVLVSFK
jgi:ribosome maturation factor RimP